MKRNWDCVRAILGALEGAPGYIHCSAVPGFDAETAAYHMKLMVDAKLIEGRCLKVVQTRDWVAEGLTWAGHEFFDKIRAESIWNRVRTLAREQGLPLSFHLIGLLADKAVGSLFG